MKWCNSSYIIIFVFGENPPGRSFYGTSILQKKHCKKKKVDNFDSFQKSNFMMCYFFLANFRTSGNINSISMHTPGTSFYSLMFIVDQSSWLF